MPRATKEAHKKRRSRARRHTVSVTLTAFDLTREGTAMTVSVRDQGEVLGELTIGRGSVVWWRRKSKLGKTIPWQRFAKIMNDA